MTDAEFEVMKVIWANPNCTAKFVFGVLQPNKQWALSTVKTLLSRLENKGYVAIEQDGRTFLYTARQSEQAVVKELLMTLLSQVCIKQRGAFLQQAIQETVLNQTDCIDLIALLTEKTNYST